MSDNNQSTNTFERERQPFKMLGKEYYFEFIPSIHFQEVMRQALEVLVDFDMLGGDVSIKPDADYSKLFSKVRVILEEKIYQILFDVLLYQNDERVEMESLKHKTSPLEIAEFLALVLSDDEIVRAMGVVASGLGKLVEKLTKTQSLTPNSTPSS
jgi:hypothetical protein